MLPLYNKRIADIGFFEASRLTNRLPRFCLVGNRDSGTDPVQLNGRIAHPEPSLPYPPRYLCYGLIRPACGRSIFACRSGLYDLVVDRFADNIVGL